MPNSLGFPSSRYDPAPLVLYHTINLCPSDPRTWQHPSILTSPSPSKLGQSLSFPTNGVQTRVPPSYVALGPPLPAHASTPSGTTASLETTCHPAFPLTHKGPPSLPQALRTPCLTTQDNAGLGHTTGLTCKHTALEDTNRVPQNAGALRPAAQSELLARLCTPLIFGRPRPPGLQAQRACSSSQPWCPAHTPPQVLPQHTHMPHLSLVPDPTQKHRAHIGVRPGHERGAAGPSVY